MAREVILKDERAILAEYGGVNQAMERSSELRKHPSAWGANGARIDGYPT